MNKVLGVMLATTFACTSVYAENRPYWQIVSEAKNDLLANYLVRSKYESDENARALNVQGPNGTTALMCAVEKGYVTTVKTLLSGGALRAVQDADQATALHKALIAEEVNGEIVTALVSKHRQPVEGNDSEEQDIQSVLRTRNSDGRTPLFIAAIDLNRADLVEVLHRNGADLFERDGQGNTLLHLAISPCDSRTRPAGRGNSYETDRTQGNLEVVRCLIRLGGNEMMNSFTTNGDTPLFQAVLVDNANRTQIVQALLDGGADVKFQRDESLPLDDVLRFVQDDAERAALHRLLEVEQPDDQGDTELPSRNDDSGIVTPYNKAIKEKMSDECAYTRVNECSGSKDVINRLNHDGKTALTLAIEKSYLKTVKELLFQGAERCVVNRDGSNPLQIALKQKPVNLKIVEALLTRQNFNALPPGTQSPEPGDIQKLLRAKNSQGHTPLHVAVVALNNPDLIRLLVEKGADLTEVDDKGQTLLHRAISPGEEDGMVDADRRSSDDDSNGEGDGRTVRFRITTGNLDAVRCLIKLSKNQLVNAQTLDGETPLQRAVLNQNTNRVELVETLLKSGAKVVVKGSKVNLISTVQLRGEEDVKKLLEAARFKEVGGDLYIENGDIGQNNSFIDEHPYLVYGGVTVLSVVLLGTTIYFVVKKLKGDPEPAAEPKQEEASADATSGRQVGEPVGRSFSED